MVSSSGGPQAAVTKETIGDLNFYQIFHLDVSTREEASAIVISGSDVQKLYRRYALVFHPDKDPSDDARAAFERVKLALDTFLDPAKKSEYDQLLFAAAGSGSDGLGSSVEAQRQQAAEAEADWAERILKQKEAQERAAKAAQRRDAEEKEKTAQNILDELTHALQTPFRQMEAEMVREWDISPETLAMKQRDVQNLIAQLQKEQTMNQSMHVTEGRKRVREEP